MNLIPLVATGLKLDIKNNHILYTTDVIASAGILLMNDEIGNHDMVIITQIHTEGPVSLKMKPTRYPANRYEVGEKIGYLLVL